MTVREGNVPLLLVGIFGQVHCPLVRAGFIQLFMGYEHVLRKNIW